MSNFKEVNHGHDYQSQSRIIGLLDAVVSNGAVTKSQMEAADALKQALLTEGAGIEIVGDEIRVKLTSAGTNYDDLTLSATAFSSLNGNYTRASVGGYFDDGGDNQLDWTEDADFSWFYKDNGGGVWAVLGKRDSDGDPSVATGQWVVALTTNDPSTWSGSQNSAVPDYTAVDNDLLGISNETDELSRLTPSASIPEVSYSQGVASGMKFTAGELGIDFASSYANYSSDKPYPSSITRARIEEVYTDAVNLSNHPFDNSTANIAGNPANAKAAIDGNAAEIDTLGSQISSIQAVNTTQDNYIADNTAVLGVNQGDDQISNWGGDTDLAVLILSGMSVDSGKYNGTYSYVTLGYITGSTFSVGANDQYLYAKESGSGTWYVVYSNNSTGFFVNEFTTDPSGWANNESLTIESGSTSESVSGYDLISGYYIPDATDANVAFSVSTESPFIGGASNVRVAVNNLGDAVQGVYQNLGVINGLAAFETDFGTGFTILPNNSAAKPLFQAIETELQVLASGAGATWAAGVVQSVETSNIADLSNPATDVFGGETLTQGQVFLASGQTNAEENGFYVFDTTSTALVRWADADASADFIQNRSVQIVSDGTEWAYKGAADPVIGTTDLTFEKIRESIIADQAISEAKLTTALANKINAKVDTYAETVTLTANTWYTITHNLDTLFPVIMAYKDSTGIEEGYEKRVDNGNQISIRGTQAEDVRVAVMG